MRLEDAYRGGLLFWRGGGRRRYFLKRPNSFEYKFCTEKEKKSELFY